MSDDIVDRLNAATLSRARIRPGISGQTLEACARGTYHEVSLFDIDEAIDEIARLRAEVARLREVLHRVAEICHEIEAGDASGYEALDEIRAALEGGET